MRDHLQTLTTKLHDLLQPIIISQSRNSHRTRVVIFSPNGKVAVVKLWNSNGKWHLPGGGLKQNETPIEAAIREVAEEININLKPTELKFIKDITYEPNRKNWQLSIFKVNLKTEPALKVRPFEVNKALWLDPKTLNETNSAYDLVLCLKNCYNKDYV